MCMGCKGINRKCKGRQQLFNATAMQFANPMYNYSQSFAIILKTEAYTTRSFDTDLLLLNKLKHGSDFQLSRARCV